MPGRQRHELSTLAEQEWTTADEQPAGARLDDRCEGAIEFSLVCGFRDQDLPSDRTRRLLQVSQLGLGINTVRVVQHRDDGSLGNQLVQQPSSFATKS